MAKKIKTVDYQVSIWTVEDNQRLIDYLNKEYNISIPVLKSFPTWVFFTLPKADAIIDKKFSSIIRNVGK
jgi:hypothetical protein